MEEMKKVNKPAETNNDSKTRFRKLLDAVFAMCDAYGFHLEEHIIVKDKKTGKIWR